MGVGHVPTGQVRQERQGDDVPRCQYRGTGAKLGSLSRARVGQIGEVVAAAYLESRGASVVDRNVRIGRGEIDLIVSLGGERIAVEVKAGVASESSDPIYHFDDAKQQQVRMLAHRHGIFRVDYVGVDLSENGARVRWLPRIC